MEGRLREIERGILKKIEKMTWILRENAVNVMKYKDEMKMA